MFVPDRLKTNAFRVLRLSAGATLSEIHKAAGSMRRAVLLGVANTTDADMPLLGDISRTEADIRAAIGRLENPTQRLSDRLFWFHFAPESRDAKVQARPSEPDGAARDHDEALRASSLRSKLVSTMLLVSRSGSERSEHGIGSSSMMTTGLVRWKWNNKGLSNLPLSLQK